MYCANCHAPLYVGTQFCARCGAAVSAPIQYAQPQYVQPPYPMPPPAPPRPPRIRPWPLITAVGVLLVLVAVLALVASNGGSSHPAALPTQSIPPQSIPSLPSVPTTSSSPIEYFPSLLDHSWQIIETADDGSQVGLTFGLGAPVPAMPYQSVGTHAFNLGTNCPDINSKRDAVVPAQVLLANPYPDPLPGAYAFTFEGSSVVSEVEISYESGIKCKDMTTDDSIATIWSDGVPGDHASVQSDMFFVIHDFYTHSAADQRALLTSAAVSFGPADATTASGDDTTLDPGPPIGPDVRPDGSIPLSG